MDDVGWKQPESQIGADVHDGWEVKVDRGDLISHKRFWSVWIRPGSRLQLPKSSHHSTLSGSEAAVKARQWLIVSVSKCPYIWETVHHDHAGWMHTGDDLSLTRMAFGGW